MSDKPPRMRGCMYPGKIKMYGAKCDMWRNCYSRWERVLMFFGLKKLKVRSFVE
jgi:hypothetical protein